MKKINPINYKIHLEPDLKKFRFAGNVQILVQADEPIHEVSLNILDMAVWSCKAGKDGAFEDCPFYVNPHKEELRITLPKDMNGEITLAIDYEGNINDKMAGLYRSRYTSAGDTKYIAVSQFQESDARRAFPCFDHPAKKATFEIEMIIDKDLAAISNENPVEETRLDNGKKLVKFRQTPRMSTYLVFTGVGEFDFIQDFNKVLIRMATIPGMTKYGQFGLDFGRKSLEFCEDRFGVPYPLPKLDLIAIPDFAFGAMENWGAITFRENLLLDYPGITSKAGRERICEIIAHEIVHQWFGNLVTPSDWKYLWLNESFATYFGFGVVDHYHPEWETWDQFLASSTLSAFERDALCETLSIEIPGGEHVVINASTAPIIYSKGGSIIRQIEGYIGKENFQKGLRHYLKKYEYECASSHNLWEALEEASEKPITGMMKGWVEQPGFPVIEARKQENELILTQKRFTYLPNESDQVWPIPVTVKVFYDNEGSKTITKLLETKTMNIDIGDNAAAYKVNYGQTGFNRVRYRDKKNLCELGRLVQGKQLSSQDRWGIENDMYAHVRSGDVIFDNYLEFLSFYENEDEFLPVISIVGNLFHAYRIFDNRRDKIAVAGKNLVEKVLSKIGAEPAPDEKNTISNMRDRVIWPAAIFGSEQVTDFASNQFKTLMSGGTVHSDIMKSIMQAGALNGQDEAFDWFAGRLESSESEHERMNILIAMGCFRDSTLIEKTLQYALDTVPSRNKYIPVASVASNPHTESFMWDWYVANTDALEQFHPIHYERVITGIVPMCGHRADEVRAFFNTYVRQNPKVADVVNLSLENMEINLRMKSVSV
ncbi:MAG: M1 family metallopeptidase [Desulfobacteraceae bacterium]|nr:M1 family metallopeptidase [Desulfobacteraceae bacterium]